MRILYVGRNASIGGGSTFRHNICKGLIERGHQCWVACWPGEMVPRFRKLGVGYIWTPPAPWGAPIIEQAIRKHGIDLVHASNATPGTAAEWACKRTGTPLILSVHGILGKHDHTRSCLKTARRILTFEEIAVERLADHREVFDQSKVILLRRPIEHAPHAHQDDGPFRIVGVGRLSKRKGKNALNLIAAVERFRAESPGARLRLLGDGTLLREVRAAAVAANRRAGEEWVEVSGAVPDPFPIIGKAHVLVGASYCSLEAIMQGVAVIGAGFWGYGIIDEDNLRDAMAWNFGDVGGKWEMSEGNMLAALHRLQAAWKSPEERPRHWGLDRLIVEEHGLKQVAARIEGIYEEVLRETSAQKVVRLSPTD